MRIVLITCLLVIASSNTFAALDGMPEAVDPKKLEEVREIPMDATTAYGDAMVPDGDMDDEASLAEQQEQYRRGRMAFLFGQYKTALKFWEPLAISGNAKAQATMGWIYHTGKGAKKNLEKARYWYTRASYQSHEIALNNLGVFYEQGLGVGKNFSKAKEYYSAAANLGYAFAQYNLGMLYLNGHGVQKDKNKAIYWLEIASYQGVEQARDELKAMGREVDIPQHKAVNAKSDNSPKWHKDQHGASSQHKYHQSEHNPANTSKKPNAGKDANSSPVIFEKVAPQSQPPTPAQK